MKNYPIMTSSAIAVAALLLGGASATFGQTTNIVVDSFDASLNTEGLTPNGCSVMWGDGTIEWDNSELYPGTTGSAYVQAGFSTTDGTGSPVEDGICFEYDNWYYINTNNSPQTVDFSQYSAVQFQIMWDTTFSTMSIDQFNNPALYQSSLAGSTPGLGIGWVVPYGNLNFLTDTNIPDAASNGWVTVTVPIPAGLSGTAGTVGIYFTKYVANESTLTTIPTADFWIANVQLLGTAAPPPPPIIQVPTKATPGLNVYASTEGSGLPYDRQQVGLVASNGVSWVGSATTANPVTYSFTIDGFPQNPATQYACEAYLMMAPNPTYYDKAIDYNEANCVVASLQQGNGSTMMSFQYKVNQPSTENFTTVGTVTNTGTALGTWSVTFTSPTNVMLTAPNGNTSSFIFTNGPSFAETLDPGCYLYLGMQANNTASLNQAVCYSKFSITGVPAAMSDNFLNDTMLNTNLWFNFVATAPAGVLVLPPGALDWVNWSLPAVGFQLQAASSLSGPWTTLNNDVNFGIVGQLTQLVTTNNVSASQPNTFFRLATP